MILPIADNWFETRRYSDDITLIYEPHVIPDIHCNMWHVRGRDHDLLFDTGMGVMSLKNHVALVTEKPLLCVASHSHFDHVGGHHEFDNRIMHAAEADIMAAPTRDNTVISDYVSADIFTAAPPTRLVADGDVIDLGDRQFEVLHLPGHSPGGIALWESATGTLFSGDVVYDGYCTIHFITRCWRITPPAWSACAATRSRPCMAAIGKASAVHGLWN